MDNNQSATTHKRRVRYSGKYPKRFEEKYKEHNLEKYGDIAEHVIAKGNTPAGTHISIMKKEIADFLDVKPGQNGCDCTFGYGGHSRMFLEALNADTSLDGDDSDNHASKASASSSHLVSLDVDSVEAAKSKERLNKLGFGDDIFAVELINFANIDLACEKYGKFDFILADLGVSSMQIDNPERGFSYKVDGPLDLRLDQSKGISAAERLAQVDEEELLGMLLDNADEPYAEYIAKKVTDYKRKKKAIESTTQFKQVIEEALRDARIPEKELKDAVKKSCARCFQALRIDVNGEYEALESLMQKLPDVLKAGGRVAILTFHSGEDRIVKQYFKQFAKEGIYSEAAKDVIRPSQEECNMNPRAKSTKMRWAIRA